MSNQELDVFHLTDEQIELFQDYFTKRLSKALKGFNKKGEAYLERLRSDEETQDYN